MIIDVENEEVTMFGLLDEDVILYKTQSTLIENLSSSVCSFI